MRALLRLLWRARVKMIAGGLVGLILALAHIVSLQPTYTASATVLFTPEIRKLGHVDTMVAQPPDDGVRNQVEILRSATLLTRVVERLKPAERAELTGPAGGVSLFDWKVLVPWPLLVNLGLVATGTDGEEAQKRKARTVLRRDLRLRPLPESRVIDILYTARDPALAATIANLVAEEYIVAQLDAKFAATRRAALWLSERIDELEAEVSQSEGAVNDYRASLADRTGQTTPALKQQLEVVNAEAAEVAARRAAAEIRHRRAVAAMEEGDALAFLREFQNSRQIAEARAKERELLADRAALSRLVAPGNERLRLIDSRIEAVRHEIEREAGRTLEALADEVAVAEAAEVELSQAAVALEEKLAAQSQAEVKLRLLEQEAAASRMIFETFLARLKETSQQEKAETADAVVLSPAEAPHFADGAPAARIALFGLIGGAIAGLGVAVALERVHHTFRSIDTLEEATGITVIGRLPTAPGVEGREGLLAYLLDKPNSSLAEAMRGLRTNLLFARRDVPPKVVMVTSTAPAEGKSSVALLLAVTATRLGKKVVVVDCDLRRPALNAFFGGRARRTAGLNGILAGRASLDATLYADDDTGITVLATRLEEGAVANAADALSSERFAATVAELARRFDLVVLDAPPLLPVSDARIIAPHADATLYCVRWDATPRESVADGLRGLGRVHTRIAGLVVTMIEPDRAASFGVGSGGLFRPASDPYCED
nr:Wzz/FepE/Etk N-terminal domain-containing protein [Acuticoccus mangrovi]